MLVLCNFIKIVLLCVRNVYLCENWSIFWKYFTFITRVTNSMYFRWNGWLAFQYFLRNSYSEIRIANQCRMRSMCPVNFLRNGMVVDYAIALILHYTESSITVTMWHFFKILTKFTICITLVPATAKQRWKMLKINGNLFLDSILISEVLNIIWPRYINRQQKQVKWNMFSTS